MNNIKTFENFNNQDIFTYIKNYDIESVKNYINSGYDLYLENPSVENNCSSYKVPSGFLNWVCLLCGIVPALR